MRPPDRRKRIWPRALSLIRSLSNGLFATASSDLYLSPLMEQPLQNHTASVPILQYQGSYTLPISREISAASPLLRSLAFSPDGRYLGGAFDRYVTIWRLKEGDEDGGEEWAEMLKYRIDKLSISEEITCLSWMTTGHILIGSNIGDVKIVRLNENDTIVQGFQSSTLPVRFVTLDQAGEMLAVVSGLSKVGIWQWIEDKEYWSMVHSLPPPDRRLASDNGVEVTSIHWDPSGTKSLIVSFLNHGVLRWDMVSQGYQCLLNLDKVYGGSLSPDGRHFATTNRKGTFDIYDLSSRDKLDWLHDPDLQEAQKHVGLRTRPGVFIHGGRYFVGASIGKINMWNTARSIRSQRLSLAKDFETSQVSNTNGDEPIDNYRIAACTQGPKQVIEIWKASGRGYIPTVSIAGHLESPASSAATPSKLVTGMLIGGLAVHAASNMGLF